MKIFNQSVACDPNLLSDNLTVERLLGTVDFLQYEFSCTPPRKGIFQTPAHTPLAISEPT